VAALADMNGDGKLDLVLTGNVAGKSPGSGRPMCTPCSVTETALSGTGCARAGRRGFKWRRLPGVISEALSAGTSVASGLNVNLVISTGPLAGSGDVSGSGGGGGAIDWLSPAGLTSLVLGGDHRDRKLRRTDIEE
jgi:hypothetical protein